ncbi:c6 transcription factor protein [Rutstroemia sp. NJR-2017a BVV2]|nr:c6 transcription factor protein [Rutstroemia sp. NJR-2017a BVV2]
MSGDDTVSSPQQSTRKTRTRTGCLNCRRRRRKCDEQRPECLNCRQRGEECEWGMKITFKTGNAIELDADHASMIGPSRKRARHFKILDVTSQIVKGYQADPTENPPNTSKGFRTASTSSRSPRETGDGARPDTLLQMSRHPEQAFAERHSTWQSQSPAFDTPNSMTMSYSDSTSYRGDESSMQMDMSPSSHTSFSRLNHLGYPEQDANTPHSFCENNLLVGPSSTRSRTHTEDAAAELLALRYMPAQLSQRQSVPDVQESHTDMPPPPNINLLGGLNDESPLDQHVFDDQDGIFLPGSAYQELHSTLRDHLIYTARSNAPTRYGTPEVQQPDMGFFERGPPKVPSDSVVSGAVSDPESSRSSKPPEITPQREYILWKTWIDEVAPWLDKFDNQRHFEHKIPMMAKTTPHLKNSILALCARQIERKENSISSSESLGLYQEAIHLLLPELHTKDTAVIASCVILCVLEMMSCSPKEWRRHLEGCANLLEAVGINGFVGGINEALFWCFARMDVCGALISQDLTLIPVDNWASKIDFDSDIRLFRNPLNGFDTYANYAVFLCAKCVAYLKKFRDRAREVEPDAWTSQWTELLGLLDDWYNERPEEMKSILTIPAREDKDASPFPTVFYGNGPAVSGNQLYHTATLLLLQEKPPGLKTQRKQKSIFWHARQICAISESNTHHGAWTNSIQPIWIAGKVMSHRSEHRAILNILERIQRETGWVTTWRREDLKSWWGDD